MKIEKLSENQIRCTLSKDDLETRRLRLSELAYGTEKAQALFHDMIEQASCECGFEAQDTPLMVEAIPLSGETLVLIITKVDEPEELDTRFSQFTPDSGNIYADEDYDYDAGYDDIFEEESYINVSEGEFVTPGGDRVAVPDNFVPFSEVLSKQTESCRISEPVSKEAFENAKKADFNRIFMFQKLDDLIPACDKLFAIYYGSSHLYRNPVSGDYYLVLNKARLTLEAFNTVCNILSEYGTMCRMTYATHQYFKEHFELLIWENTVQELSILAK